MAARRTVALETAARVGQERASAFVDIGVGAQASPAVAGVKTLAVSACRRPADG